MDLIAFGGAEGWACAGVVRQQNKPTTTMPGRHSISALMTCFVIFIRGRNGRVTEVASSEARATDWPAQRWVAEGG